LKKDKNIGSFNILDMDIPTPGPKVQGGLMLAILMSFASTSFSIQALILLFSCAFVLFYRRALMVSYADGGGVILLLLLAVMMLAVPLNIWRNPSVVAYILVEFITVALAFVLVSNKESYWRASKIVLLVTQALVLVYLVRVGLDDFPLEDMIPGASSNGITSYLILLQCNYSLARFAANQRVSLFTSAVTVVICIVGFGRGSLVASLGLFALNIFYLPRQWGLLGRWWPALTIIVVFFLLLPNMDSVISYLDANTKLGAGFVDDSRTSILNAYFAKLDSWSIIWGADYSGTGIDEEYRGNPHNSFIRAHHMFGLLYLLIVIIFVIKSLIVKIDFALRAYAFSVLIIFLFRAFTEPIILPTLLDVYLFAMCLILIHKNKNSEALLAR
jgi:hypothetical protein